MRRLIMALIGLFLGLGAVALGLDSPALAADVCQSFSANMVRPDSSVAGPTWATDAFKREGKACVQPTVAEKGVEVQSATYLVTGTDTGTFKTEGTKSPQTGATMKTGLTGTLKGEWTAKCVAPAPASDGTWPYFGVHGTDKDSTSVWVDGLWEQPAKSKCELTSWKWTYVSCNQTWVNAQTGNKGDITGNYTKDQGHYKCPTPTPSATTSPVPSKTAVQVPVNNATTPSLPVTGSKTTSLVISGVLLLVGGTAAVLFARRRRTKFIA